MCCDVVMCSYFLPKPKSNPLLSLSTVPRRKGQVAAHFYVIISYHRAVRTANALPIHGPVGPRRAPSLPLGLLGPAVSVHPPLGRRHTRAFEPRPTTPRCHCRGYRCLWFLSVGAAAVGKLPGRPSHYQLCRHQEGWTQSHVVDVGTGVQNERL